MQKKYAVPVLILICFLFLCIGDFLKLMTKYPAFYEGMFFRWDSFALKLVASIVMFSPLYFLKKDIKWAKFIYLFSIFGLIGLCCYWVLLR